MLTCHARHAKIEHMNTSPAAKTATSPSLIGRTVKVLESRTEVRGNCTTITPLPGKVGTVTEQYASTNDKGERVTEYAVALPDGSRVRVTSMTVLDYPTPTLGDVTVTPDEGNYVCVHASWRGPERTDGHGWVTTKANAKRLVRAIEAGAVFSEPTVRTDVYGNTYVQASSKVLGRYMNADLKRLGF